MTAQPAAATGHGAGRGRTISMLDLLDDSATGRGTVHFPGEEPEPTPISELWDASGQAARWMAATVGTGGTVAAVLAALEPGAGDASCSWLPLSHDMGLIGQLLSPLAAGAPEFGHHCLTLMKPEAFMANPRSWLRTCSETGSTITVAPNFALELAVRTSRRIGSLDLSRLRAIIVGSESVRADTLVRFADAYAPSGFRPLALCPGYGLAEATLAVTIVRPHEPWRSIPRPADHGAPE